MHANVFPFTGLVGTCRQRTHKKYVAPYPYLFSTYGAPMQVKNISKFNEFSNLPSPCD